MQRMMAEAGHRYLQQIRGSDGKLPSGWAARGMKNRGGISASVTGAHTQPHVHIHKTLTHRHTQTHTQLNRWSDRSGSLCMNAP